MCFRMLFIVLVRLQKNLATTGDSCKVRLARGVAIAMGGTELWCCHSIRCIAADNATVAKDLAYNARLHSSQCIAPLPENGQCRCSDCDALNNAINVWQSFLMSAPEQLEYKYEVQGIFMRRKQWNWWVGDDDNALHCTGHCVRLLGKLELQVAACTGQMSSVKKKG